MRRYDERDFRGYRIRDGKLCELPLPRRVEKEPLDDPEDDEPPKIEEDSE